MATVVIWSPRPLTTVAEISLPARLRASIPGWDATAVAIASMVSGRGARLVLGVRCPFQRPTMILMDLELGGIEVPLASSVGYRVLETDRLVMEMAKRLPEGTDIGEAFMSVIRPGRAEKVHRHELDYSAMFLVDGEAVARDPQGKKLRDVVMHKGEILDFKVDGSVEHYLDASGPAAPEGARYVVLEYRLPDGAEMSGAAAWSAAR